MRVDNNIDKNIQLKASTSNTHTTCTSGTIVKTASLYHKSDSTFEQNISEKGILIFNNLLYYLYVNK